MCVRVRVYVSYRKSLKEYLSHMLACSPVRQGHTPTCAPNTQIREGIMSKFQVQGIPRLVILGPSGNVACDNAVQVCVCVCMCMSVRVRVSVYVHAHV